MEEEVSTRGRVSFIIQQGVRGEWGDRTGRALHSHTTLLLTQPFQEGYRLHRSPLYCLLSYPPPGAEVELDSPRDIVIDLRLSPQLTQLLTTNNGSEGAIDLDVIGLQVSGHPRGHLYTHYVMIHSGDNTGVSELDGR